MVNLIIALISIALIAIIAVSALYSGGDSFREGGDKAEATRIQNGLNQVYMGYELYIAKNGGEKPNPSGGQSLANFLVEKDYLSDIPRGVDFDTDTELSYNFCTNNEYICEQVGNEDKAKAYNKAFGGDGETVPSCDDDFDPKYPVCVKGNG